MISGVVLKNNVSFIGKNRKLLILRGIFGFAALAMNFYAIAELPLGLAVILNSTSPIFVAILAAPILGERVSKRL